MILGQLADVIDGLDLCVGVDRLEQVVLQQVSRRVLGEFGVVADLDRVQHALGEDAVAEGRVALTAAKEGQPKLIVGGQTFSLTRA